MRALRVGAIIAGAALLSAAPPIAWAQAPEFGPGDQVSCGADGHSVGVVPQADPAVANGVFFPISRQQPLSGEIRIATLLVDRLGYADDLYSVEQVDRLLYGPSNSLAKSIEHMSFGTFGLAGDEGDIFPLALNGLAPTEHCDFDWSVDLAAEWRAQTPGSEIYTHVMVLVEDSNRCGGVLGTAYVAAYEYGGDTSFYASSWFQGGLNVMAHELFHTLGLLHSGYDANLNLIADAGDVEYGDPTCIMGNEPGNMTLNAPYRLQMGWYQQEAEAIVEHPETGEHRLYTLGPVPKPSEPQIIRIPVAGQGKSLVLSYRNLEEGPDSGFPAEFRGEVAVHWHDLNDDPFNDRAMILGILQAGNVVTFDDVEGNPVDIEVLAFGAGFGIGGDYATIRIGSEGGSGRAPEDRLAPTVEWLEPLADLDASASDARVEVPLRVRAEDPDSSLAQVSVLVGDREIVLEREDPLAEIFTGVAKLRPGRHVLRAVAVDRSGNEGEAWNGFAIAGADLTGGEGDKQKGGDDELVAGASLTPRGGEGPLGCAGTSASALLWLWLGLGWLTRRWWMGR